jgi:hypothetical protein
MRILSFLFASLILSGTGVGTAFACPAGTIPNPIGAGGQPECIPGENHQNWGGNGGSSEPSYARRWGAFASDPVNSKVGLSTGLSSKRKAEKEAMAHCRSKGGVDCKVLISYYNQCAAVAWGPDSNGKGDLVSAHAPQKGQAEELAIGECSKTSSSCKVFFAECSYAERTN